VFCGNVTDQAPSFGEPCLVITKLARAAESAHCDRVAPAACHLGKNVVGIRMRVIDQIMSHTDLARGKWILLNWTDTRLKLAVGLPAVHVL